MKPKTCLQIIEPSDIIVEGLKSILGESDDFNILAPLHDAVGLSERLPALSPDMLLVNPTVMGVHARQSLSSIQSARPNMPVVALVYEYVEPGLLQAFDGVVDIRMPRNKVAAELRSCLKEADAGSHDQVENYELSDRETDVLVLVAKGLSSKEIADSLNISVHTVNSHRKNITRKTGIKSVAGLAVYAMLHNLT